MIAADSNSNCCFRFLREVKVEGWQLNYTVRIIIMLIRTMIIMIIIADHHYDQMDMWPSTEEADRSARGVPTAASPLQQEVIMTMMMTVTMMLRMMVIITMPKTVRMPMIER